MLSKARPRGNVPIKLYEVAALPVFEATVRLTAVVLSTVKDDEESVMIGASLYAVNVPADTPVPTSLVIAIVPEALPAAEIAVIEVELLTVNEATGLPPIVTREVLVKLEPVIAIEVPATPFVGVKEIPEGALAT